MHTAHPTLLIGPSDWKPERMPKEEFLRRIDALWQIAPAVSQAIIFGSPAHHAELAYLTNHIPKLEPTAALLTRAGAHRLFVGGGANMLGAARPLSFITELAPLNGLGTALRQPAQSPTLLIGGGYMSTALRQTICDALGNAAPEDLSAQLWRVMRRKSRAELDAIRAACAVLDEAMTAIGDAQRSGAGATAAVLAGEKAANASGAQDVRTLFSLDGGRTLRPFETLIDEAVDPLQVYVAVRRLNYWAEGFALFSSAPHSLAGRASTILRASLSAIAPGTSIAAAAQTIAAAIAPARVHPVATRFAGRVGLALAESPHTGLGATFEADEVYSLRIGLSEGAHVIVSAMLAVREGGNEVLWQSPS